MRGARLIVGGLGRPEGFERRFFTRPTVFVDVTPKMTICRKQIFGPVLTVVPYSTEAQASDIANDSPNGLGGYVFSGDRRKAYAFASRASLF
jgi:aldehyde dehydrogenase (NAD+)